MCRAETSERGQRYDGRFPVERIKNSVLKPWAGQPFVRRTEGAPFGREKGAGADNGARGVCRLLVCALFTHSDSLRRGTGGKEGALGVAHPS